MSLKVSHFSNPCHLFIDVLSGLSSDLSNAKMAPSSQSVLTLPCGQKPRLCYSLAISLVVIMLLCVCMMLSTFLMDVVAVELRETWFDRLGFPIDQ